MKTVLTISAGIFIAAAIVIFLQQPTPKADAISTWVHTEGMPLYDTPSGNLDVGYYEILTGGVLFGHIATTTTATTTLPTMYRVPPNAIGLTRANRIGTRYIDYFADGAAYFGSTTIDAALNQVNAPIPSEAVDQAAGSAI